MLVWFKTARVSALLAATFGATLIAGAQPALAQSAIKVVVNNEPITTNEINQRARFLTLVTHQPPSSQLTNQSMEELIDEKIKFQEAKRVGISANEAQVDQAFGAIASRVKITPQALAAGLAQAGVDSKTLRNRLRAQIVWQQLVVNRFRRSVTISDSDIVAALGKQQQKPGEAVDPKAMAMQTEYNLQQVIFVVPDKERAQIPARMKDAEQLRAKVAGCETLIPAAKAYKEAIVKSIGKRIDSEIPENLRGGLKDTPVGKMTKPVATANGVELLAVCETREIQTDSSVRTKVEDDLREKEGQLMARRYIGDLRRMAVIDYK